MSYRKYPPDPPRPNRASFWALIAIGLVVLIASQVGRFL